MTFTWFSAVLGAAVLLMVGTGILRGIRRGAWLTLVNISFLILSVIFGVMLSRLLSSVAVEAFAEDIRLEFFEGELIGGKAHIDELVLAIAKMLIGSVLFVFTFLGVRAALAFIFRMVERRLKRTESGAYTGLRHVCVTVFESNEGTKREKLLGGVLGAVSGVILALAVTSPIVGPMNLSGKLLEVADSGGVYFWESAQLDRKAVMELDKYSEDGVAKILYHMGGKHIYASSASASIRGRNLVLSHEIEAVSESVVGIIDVYPMFTSLERISDEDRLAIDALCDSVDDSYTVKCVSAEFVSECAEAWLSGKRHMGVEVPDFGDALGPVFDDILRVCQTTNEEYISQDMRSLLNIYIIIVNSGLIDNAYNISLEDITVGGEFIDAINEEISKNPRLALVKRSLRSTAARIISEQIHLPEYSEEEYNTLMDNLATAINRVRNEEGASFEMQKEKLSSYTKEYINEFGAEIGDSMVDVASEALLEQFGGSSGDISPEDLDSFFKEILG